LVGRATRACPLGRFASLTRGWHDSLSQLNAGSWSVSPAIRTFLHPIVAATRQITSSALRGLDANDAQFLRGIFAGLQMKKTQSEAQIYKDSVWWGRCDLRARWVRAQPWLRRASPLGIHHGCLSRLWEMCRLPIEDMNMHDES
jgi:hypothetical protein